MMSARSAGWRRDMVLGDLRRRSGEERLDELGDKVIRQMVIENH
jgi:hypothetical protein